MNKWPLLPIMERVVRIAATAFLLGAQGCGPKYCPVTQRTRDGAVEYRCTVGTDADGYSSTLTREPDVADRRLRLQGKAVCIAVSHRGDVAVVALLSSRAEAEPGLHEIVFIDTGSFKIRNRWAVRPEGMLLAEHGDYAPSIQRLDSMALSEDGAMLATYYWKPVVGEGHRPVVTLWEAASGRQIRELAMLAPEESEESLSGMAHGENVSSMAFSSDASLLAVSGAWSIKDPHAVQPDGFVQIWRTVDGRRETFRPKGRRFLWNLCFNQAGTHLAGWSWASKGTELAEVSVWRIPEGRFEKSRHVRERVLGITWSSSLGAFRVNLGKAGEAVINPTSSGL